MAMTASATEPLQPFDLVVDSSAVIAVLLHEPQSEAVLRRLAEAQRPAMAAPTRTEILLVALTKLGASGRELADAAALAFERFGRGRHPSALNFGDCFSYALAERLRLPLLFLGNDFRQTDITPALEGPTAP